MTRVDDEVGCRKKCTMFLFWLMVVDDEVGWRMEWMSLIWLLMVDDVVGSTSRMEWIISSLLELVMWLSGSSTSSRQLKF
jgi:hypothetical protein